MTDENQIDRRTVLRNMAAGATVLAGASGLGSATTGKAPVSRFERDAAVQGYESPEAVRSVLSDHEDMLETLAAKGLVEAASADELSLDPQGETRAEGHERVTAIRRTDGSVTPEIKITRQTADGKVTIGVLPESGERWVLEGTSDSRGPITHDDVTTRSCCDCCTMEKVCCTSECADYCWECACPDDCC